jgi:hypothetical protein
MRREVGMRQFISDVGLMLVCLATGCNHWPFLKSSPEPAGLRVPSATPAAQELVSVLNDNSRRVQALECRSMSVECSEHGRPISLQAAMVCQKPRSFRMSAKILGSTGVDMGSNDQEFWYWISKAEPPYLFHCSYQDFASGQVRMPFPFQPDWIIEALGMADYDPAKVYEINNRQGRIELVEKAISPQGQPVRKVTVVSRMRNGYQVTAHVLQDANGNEICSALVTEIQQDPTTGALLPRAVKLEWPAERIVMKMRLDGLAVNPGLPPERVARLFTRPAFQNVPSYDLARGLDGQADGIRRTRGAIR